MYRAVEVQGTKRGCKLILYSCVRTGPTHAETKVTDRNVELSHREEIIYSCGNNDQEFCG